MNITQRSLVGTDVIVGAYRGTEEPDEPTDDGLSEAVDELLGLDLKQVTPYFSAAMSALPQGEDKEKEAREAEQKKEEEEKSKASSKKTLVVVLGVLAAGLLGLGGLLLARKK